MDARSYFRAARAALYTLLLSAASLVLVLGAVVVAECMG